MVRRNFTITMDDEVMEESKEYSRKLKIPNSHFIQQCVEKVLKETKEEKIECEIK